MVPNRDTLIVVGSEDALGLAGMAKLAAKAMKEPRLPEYQASPCGSNAGDDLTGFLTYRILPTKRFKRVNTDPWAGPCPAKEMPDVARQERGGSFRKNFSAIKRPDGKVLSYATWTETANSLLPKTDTLILGRIGSGFHQMVERQKVVDARGDQMEAVAYLSAAVSYL